MFSLIRNWGKSEGLKKRAACSAGSRLWLEALEERWLPAPIAPLSPLPAGIAGVFSGDFNGDGKTDLAQFTSDGRWLVSLNTSTPGGATTFAPPAQWAHWSLAGTWRQLFVGDFNGDGKTDVAGFSTAGDWFVGLSNGTDSFITGAPWATFGTGSSTVWTKLFVADFTGDGKDDIAGFGFNGNWFVGVSQAPATSTNQSTFTVGAPWANFGTGSPNVWIQTFVGDFSGDGRADIAGFGFNGNWFVGVSNGTDTFSVGAPWANWGSPTSWMDPGATTLNTSLNGDSNVLTSAGTGPRIRLYVGDFNGDGRTDIAGLGFNGNMFVGLSNGADTFATGPFWANLGNPNNVTGLFIGDVNGGVGTRERDDIVEFNSAGQWIVGISQSGVAGGSDTFLISPTPFANYGSPANWVALAVGHNPTDYNPTQEFTHPAAYSTEFNSTALTMDTQADIAALGFNLSWFVGISAPTPNPTQFLTGPVAVQW